MKLLDTYYISKRNINAVLVVLDCNLAFCHTILIHIPIADIMHTLLSMVPCIVSTIIFPLHVLSERCDRCKLELVETVTEGLVYNSSIDNLRSRTQMTSTHNFCSYHCLQPLSVRCPPSAPSRCTVDFI